MLSDTLNLRLEIEEVKRKISNHNQNIELIFSYLDELLKKKDGLPPGKEIGFKSGN
jgi:uncharacterized membrane protein